MENLKTIELKVTVSYRVEEGRSPYEEAEWASAIDLAISPNFHTVENGVSLERVEIEYPDGAKKTLQKETGEFGVFPIVNGCSTDCVYSGSKEDCISYGKEKLKPGEYIITPLP